MEILWFKLLSLLIIFSIGLFAGIIPSRKSIGLKAEGRLMLGNAFAGGVFLGAGLLHMFPDAIDNFNSLAGHINFPVPALIAGLGFLLVMILEKAASGTHHHDDIVAKNTSVSPVILYLILSVHSIIAGTSLGLEGGLISATAIFIAIIAHKGAASFSLGVSLKKNDFSEKKHIITIAIFSIMTPLGVVLGTIFTKVLSGEASMTFEMIFDSLATGTFLYIAIAEIISEVFEKHGDLWRKLILITTGFCLMAVIAIWV